MLNVIKTHIIGEDIKTRFMWSQTNVKVSRKYILSGIVSQFRLAMTSASFFAIFSFSKTSNFRTQLVIRVRTFKSMIWSNDMVHLTMICSNGLICSFFPAILRYFKQTKTGAFDFLPNYYSFSEASSISISWWALLGPYYIKYKYEPLS